MLRVTKNYYAFLEAPLFTFHSL